MNVGDKAPEILGKDEQGRDIRLRDACSSVNEITINERRLNLAK